MKKLWCLFRRRSANGADKICVADSETEGRVCACKFATEEEAKAARKARTKGSNDPLRTMRFVGMYGGVW